MRDLGSRVFVAWRSRLTHRRLALFRRRDVHARRIRADAATTLADDGRSGGGQRDATVRYKYGVRVRGDAGVLVNARQVCDLQPRLTRIDRKLPLTTCAIVPGRSGDLLTPSPPAEKATTC